MCGINTLEKAIIYATKAHSGMTRKGKETPYILHPMEAAAIVSTMTNDHNIIAAALLHDVIEDTDITELELRGEFNNTICDIVLHESENKRETLPAQETWDIRKNETIESLIGAKQEVKMVALGDKLSNIRAIRRDYNDFGDGLWERFNQKDPKKQGAYYHSLINALSDLAEYGAWQEYKKLVYEVFGE